MIKNWGLLAFQSASFPHWFFMLRFNYKIVVLQWIYLILKNINLFYHNYMFMVAKEDMYVEWLNICNKGL